MKTALRLLPAIVVTGLLGTACGGPEPATPTVTAAPSGTGTAIACAHVVDRLDAPPAGWVVLADAVAVQPARLEPSRSGGTDPAALFAKTGLVLRADARVELAVPATSTGRPWIGWGSPARPARTLHFPGCAAESGWLALAGGFWVDVPACVPLTIRSAGREERIRIRVGADCPG